MIFVILVVIIADKNILMVRDYYLSDYPMATSYGGIETLTVIHIIPHMYKIDKKRPLSWSAISSFEYDPEQWFKRYILNEKQEESSAMAFGKEIGEKYIYGPTFKREYKLQAKLGSIPLIGYIDAFDLENKVLIELKTGKKWDKKKAETHGQIDLYCAMLWAQHKIHPGELDIRLIWLETEQLGDFSTQFVKDMKPVVFPIKKSMLDVLNMLARVKRVYAQMEKYVAELSTDNLQNNTSM